MASLRHGTALLAVALLVATGLTVQPTQASIGPTSSLFAVDGFGSGPNTLYTIDTTTAVPSAIGPLGLAEDTPNGLTDDGITIFTQTASPATVYSVDPLTAATTSLFPFGIGFAPEGSLAYDEKSGIIFSICALCADDDNSLLFSFPPGGPVVTEIAPLSFGGLPTGNLNVDGADFRSGTLYGAVAGDFGGNGLDNHLVTIDTATGAVSDVGDMGIDITGASLAGLAYSPHEDLFYLIDHDGTLYTVDPVTAAATFVGETGLMSVSGATYLAPTAIPIPVNVFGCFFPDDARPFRGNELCRPGKVVGDTQGGAFTHNQSDCRYHYRDGFSWDRIRARTIVPHGSDIAIVCEPQVNGWVELELFALTAVP